MTASTAAGMATTGSDMAAAAESEPGRTSAVQDSPPVQNSPEVQDSRADPGLWDRNLRFAAARG
jgi:hypothetical protein